MATGSEPSRKNNTLHMWGNERTMNINHLILTNIVTSNYFKNDLQRLKTFHEIVDEIYNQVSHLEPWEKGSRKLAGQTGMCGGVRGVGAGGIVSSAFTLLYKLFTLKLTRKQLNNLLNHPDSPFIRGLGFMYIRYCQEPSDLWGWFKDYLDDEEEIDVKAGGGRLITIGELCQMMLSKLDWFGTLFPRIPIPIQKDIENKLREYNSNQSCIRERGNDIDWGEAGRLSKLRAERISSDEEERKEGSRERDTQKYSSRSRSHSPDYSRLHPRSRSPRDRSFKQSKDRYHKRRRSSPEESSSRRYAHKSHKHARSRRHRSSSSPRHISEDRYRSRYYDRRHRQDRQHSDSPERYRHTSKKESTKKRSKYSGDDSPM
ncbi:Pre-mRNA-splicing factor 38B-like [Oopsacas minuta]|uniref:Pre-mRNA-splicing factor 38 n=1 Tax=Oopsacas minuta TaxID=111878 RepID=A0AAV7KG36_9METZ|nr:Pre-mRNA-splicing factor 38B-like [Oopsacas minuta]